MLSRLAYMCALNALLALAGCAKTTDMPAGGSESHFLMACDDTSECGGDLECHGGVCTRECETDAVCELLSADASCLVLGGEDARFCGIETDAGVPDGSVPVPDDDASVPIPTELGMSQPLDEPIQVAFIAGLDSEEQIWLRGEAGTLRQISVWQVEPSRAVSCGEVRSTTGYPSGGGRFANLTFDPSGRFLVFSESLECAPDRRQRVIAHELATGRSRAIADFATGPLLLADKHALLVIVRHEGDIDLYDFEAVGPSLKSVEVPEGNAVDHAWTQLVSLGNSSLLMMPGLPALERTDGEFRLSALDPFVPDHRFGVLGGDPLGTHLCVLASARSGMSRTALLFTPDQVWMQELRDAQGELGRGCAISADGQYLMYGAESFVMQDGLLKPLPTPFDGSVVHGAYGGAFYATNPEGEFVRLDLAAGTRETVLELDDLERLCGDAVWESAITELIMPQDERPLAIVKRHCGCIDCDISGSLALRLDDHTFQTVELRAGEHDAYGVVWPVAGGALVFSSQSQSGGDPSTIESIGVSVRGEVGALPGLEGAPLLHGPAVPRRRPTANAAPLQCDLEDISRLLLTGQPFEDCGSISLDDDEDLEAALQCAADAYDIGSAFRVLWRTQGDDSVLESGLVGRASPAGYEVFDLRYDSFGWVDIGTATFTACVNHGTQTCEDASGQCPTCDATGAQCRCKPHDQSENGVELTCDAP